MTILFSKSPGRVFRYQDVAIPMTVRVEGFGAGMSCALTALGVAGRVNAKVTHAFSQMIYVYTMGERVGDLQLSGVTFPGLCDQQIGPFGLMPPSGLENLLDYYYTQFGLAATGKAVRVTVGTKVIEGLLMGFRADNADPQTGVGAFSMLLNFFPQLKSQAF